MDKKFFGKRLKELRNRKCLTQTQLAEKVGLHEKQISKIESGVHFPTFENFIKLMDILNVTMSDFDDRKGTCSKDKLKAAYIIRNATEDEINFYLPILEQLKKCMSIRNEKLISKNPEYFL